MYFRQNIIANHIPNVVSEEGNILLINYPSNYETKLFLISNRAASPNGFGSFCFHACKDILRTDVCNVVK